MMLSFGSRAGRDHASDGNGAAGNVRNDNRGSSAGQLADIGRELNLKGKSFSTDGLRTARQWFAAFLQLFHFQKFGLKPPTPVGKSPTVSRNFSKPLNA